MKTLFQELSTLKPEPLAKTTLLEKLEEHEMKKHRYSKHIGKYAVGLILAIGFCSIPFVQTLVGTSITAEAKQVEQLNKQIEDANEQYLNKLLTHEEYKAIVTPMEADLIKAVEDAKALDPNFEVTLVTSLDENGEVTQDYTITDAK